MLEQTDYTGSLCMSGEVEASAPSCNKPAGLLGSARAGAAKPASSGIAQAARRLCQRHPKRQQVRILSYWNSANMEMAYQLVKSRLWRC